MSPRDFDVLIATDLRHSGGTTASIAQEVEVQARMGLKTGLVQLSAPYLAPVPWAARIRSLVGAGLAEIVSPKRAVTARLLVLRHPRVFAGPDWKLAARGDHTLLVANQVPQDGARPDPYYDVPTVVDRVAAELGTAPVWAPIGPMVRDALQALPGAPQLTPFDWHNIIDVDAWARPRARRTGTRTIGRHSRDDVKKWPERADDLLAAYPEREDVRVRVLGGAHAVRKILGREPQGWDVLPFGSVAPEDFLATLDAYVYLHHSGLREAFGRAPLEALAAGLPVVTHPYLERLFGDACAYAEPADAMRVVDELVRERPVNQRGLDLVRDRYDWDAHRRRLGTYLAGALPAISRSRAPRKRVLFVTSNGGGMGHLTRALAIARRLPADHEALFLTMSSGFDAVSKEGFWVDYMPSRESGELSMQQWLEYLRLRVVTAVRTLRPRALVFDGTFAYKGLTLALAQFPDLLKVWSRRGMWKPISQQRHGQSLQQLAAFDLVIEPGELAGEADHGVTMEQRAAARVIEPIVYLDRSELLSREDARRELGIPPDATSGLINLGAGNINRLDHVYQAVAEMLGRHRDIHVVGARSLISQRGIPIDPARVHPVETYPLSRMFRAFDFCIAAPGYNSFHELLAHGVPSIFIPNEETALDDQAARADWARRHGLALAASEREPAELDAAIAQLMRPDVRESLRARCLELPPLDGARQAAELVATSQPAAREAPRPRPRPARVAEEPRRAARSALHPVELVRVTRRRIRRTRRAIQPHAGRALHTLRVRAGEVLPWVTLPPPAAEEPPPPPVHPPATRVLLVTGDELPDGGEVDALVDWASAHRGGAVFLAGPRALPRLRRAGLMAELVTDRERDAIEDRLDYTAYLGEKARLLLSTYNCGPVLFWGDTELQAHWPVLLLLDR